MNDTLRYKEKQRKKIVPSYPPTPKSKSPAIQLLFKIEQLPNFPPLLLSMMFLVYTFY